MRRIFWCFCAVLLAGACGGGGGSGAGAGVRLTPSPSPSGPAQLYQPLAVGDAWTYLCNGAFSIHNAVIGTTTVAAQVTYELSLQIPSSPIKSTTLVQLLANDPAGNTSIYGYLIGGAVQAVRPTAIVAAEPTETTSYNYPAPDGTTVSRVFKGFESSNPTKLGTFRVAPYFENGGTHNYGYALGTGVVEEDHGPNFEFDCLVTSVVLH
jgi:hypothetical protein